MSGRPNTCMQPKLSGMNMTEPDFNAANPSEGLSLNKITILVTIGALGFLSWHFSERGGEADQSRLDKTSVAIGRQQTPIEQDLTDEDSPPERPADKGQPGYKDRSRAGLKQPQSVSDRQADLQTSISADSNEPLPAEGPSRPNGPQLSLTGVIRIGEGDDRALIRRRKGARDGIWISIGEEFQGWYLRELDLDSAVIEANGDRVELRLY